MASSSIQPALGYFLISTFPHISEANIRASLSNPLGNFNDDLEIGVSAISLSSDFFHSPHENIISIETSYKRQRTRTRFETLVQYDEIRLPRGHYTTKTLCRTLNIHFAASNSSAVMENPLEVVLSPFGPKLSQISWSIPPSVRFDFSQEMAAFLGCSPNSLRRGKNIATPNLYYNFRRVLIFCPDIRPNTFVNNKITSILNCFPIKENFQINPQLMEFNFPAILYHKLNTSLLEDLRINFTDEKGRPILIPADGYVSVNLHIRRNPTLTRL